MEIELQKETVLVADDSFASRALLRKTLSEDYAVIEASDGAQALTALNDPARDVAAVVLDLRMPAMDGYEVLAAMRKDTSLHDIPVIVETSYDDMENQMRALESGADDVVAKPLNPKLVLRRVKNAIARKEAIRKAAYAQALEHLLQKAEIDEKTGVFEKRAFCRKAAQMIRSHPDRSYVVLQWDIDRFKVFNDAFGVAAGDDYLAKVGSACKEQAHTGVLCGHWEADRFVACMEKEQFETRDVKRSLDEMVASLHDEFEFVTRLGVYEVDDPSIDVALMCDRAFLALRSTKGDYSTREAHYDESMRSALVEEQDIVGEMGRALEKGQFVIYLQPQYNYAVHAISGAEALVRWAHPEKGLIPPDKFIPAFERNGFISRLDEYVWELACKQQRAWLDEGRPVVPISVNVSRRDIYNPNLCDTFEKLLEKHQIPRSLLKLEITESAYMENADQLIRTVHALRASGFSVEMDDFGSGYSSLNILKEVPVDALKLDMRFLAESDSDSKGDSILTSVIRMANWMGLPVIAEGVETKARADYLKSVGCPRMQGYFFAKPMPVKEFETLLEKSCTAPGDHADCSGNVEGAEDFLSASTQAALLFNSFVGGAAIFEYDGENVEVLRLNDRYLEILGTTWEAYAGKQLRLLERFDDANAEVFLSTVHRAIDTGIETGCEVRSLPLGGQREGTWTRARMRLLAHTETRYLLYVSIENISHTKQLAERLRSIMDTVPDGILDFEKTDRIRVLYFNDAAASMFGYSREAYGRHVEGDPLSLVHPEDLPGVRSNIRTMLRCSSQSTKSMYRHRCADGTWRWVRLTARIARRENDAVFASGILTDIDSEVRTGQIASRQATELDRQRQTLQTLHDTIPCGIMQFAAEEGVEGIAGLISFNNATWKIYGYESREAYIEAVHGKSKFKDIYAEDLPALKELISELLESEPGRRESVEHRIIRQDGSMRWLRSELQKVRFASGEDEFLQVVFTDITAQKLDDAKKLTSAFLGLYDEIFEFDIESNLCIMRSAKDPDDPRIGVTTTFSKYLETLCTRYACLGEGTRIRNFYGSACGKPDIRPQTIEYRYLREDGESRWASATVIHVNGSSYLTCNRDETDQKATVALSARVDELVEQTTGWKKDSERNRILVEQGELLVYDYDLGTDTLRIQRKGSQDGTFEEVTERYLETIEANPVISLADRARLKSTFKEMLAKPGTGTFAYRSSRFGGGFCQCFAHMTSVAGEDGKAYRIVGQICRIQNARETLVEGDLSERIGELDRYASTLLALFDEVIELNYNHDTFIPIASKHSCAAPLKAMASIAEAIEFWRSHLADADRDSLTKFTEIECIRASFRKGLTPVLEYETALPEDNPQRCLSVLLQMETGRYLCCNKDVTEYRQAEDLKEELQALERLVKEQDRYRIVVEQAGIAIIDVNPKEKAFWSSQTYERYEMSKHGHDDILANTADRRLVHPDDQLALEGFFRAVGEGAPSAKSDLRLKMTDGSFRWTRMTGFFSKDKSGNPVRIIGSFSDIDEEMRAKTASVQLADRLNRIMTSIPAGIVIYEMGFEALPVYVSDRACELLGYSRADLDILIANARQIGFSPDRSMLQPEKLDQLLSGTPIVVDRFRPSGGAVDQRTWLRAFCSLGEDRDGTLLCYAVITDVTDEIERSQERAWQAEKYRLLSESTDAITFDYSPVDDSMRVSMALPGKGLVEEVHERYMETFATSRLIPDEGKSDFMRALRSACEAATNGVYDFESDYYREETRWYRARYTSLADENGKVYRIVGRLDDIDDIMAKQKELSVSAQFDGVSGTYNKNYAVSAIADTLKAKDPSRLDAVIFLDIDNFKLLNDTYGHLKADEALRRVGEILKTLFRSGDIVARFGGDEFIVYMRSIAAIDNAEEKAQAILEAIGSIDVNGERPVRCSIGIAGIVGKGVDYDAALGSADKALYKAKKQGKNCYAVYRR